MSYPSFDVDKKYTVLQSIGKGSAGNVFLCKSKRDHKSYALKQIFLDKRKKSRSKDIVLREVWVYLSNYRFIFWNMCNKPSIYFIVFAIYRFTISFSPKKPCNRVFNIYIYQHRTTKQFNLLRRTYYFISDSRQKLALYLT